MKSNFYTLGTKYPLSDIPGCELHTAFIFIYKDILFFEIYKSVMYKKEKLVWEDGSLTCAIYVQKNILFFIFKLNDDLHCFPMNIYTDDSIDIEEWLQALAHSITFNIMIYSSYKHKLLTMRSARLKDSNVIHAAIVKFLKCYRNYFQAEAVINEIMTIMTVEEMFNMAMKIYPLLPKEYTQR